MSGRFTGPATIDGSSFTATSKRSVAKRIAPYSRSTALIRPIHLNASSGMRFHVVDHAPKRSLRQRPGFGLADVSDHGCILKPIMHVPAVVVIVQAGNVIVRRHQVEIDEALRARSASRP